MDKVTVDSQGLVMLNGVHCNSIPFVSEKANRGQQLVIYNSGKFYKSFKDAIHEAPIKAWHLIIGREENQIFQVGNFKQGLPCGKPSIQDKSINILFINWGKLSCNKNQHINCFKKEETDIYIENGQAWHAYTKYQIYIAMEIARGNSRSIIAGPKSSYGGPPTPQFPILELNASK